MPSSVSLPEILRAQESATLASLHTCLPGVVKKFDPATQTVDVQPSIRLAPPNADEEPEDPPVIPRVPIAWPRGGGYAVVFPVAPGDHVLLVFSESATGAWRGSGQLSDPGDLRRHGLGYPFAIPGVAPSTAPLVDAGAVNMVVGRDGQAPQLVISPTEIKLGRTATDFVALATLVMAELNKLRTAFNSHVHATAGTGTPSGPVPIPSVIPVPAIAPVAAAITKAL